MNLAVLVVQHVSGGSQGQPWKKLNPFQLLIAIKNEVRKTIV